MKYTISTRMVSRPTLARINAWCRRYPPLLALWYVVVPVILFCCYLGLVGSALVVGALIFDVCLAVTGTEGPPFLVMGCLFLAVVAWLGGRSLLRFQADLAFGQVDVDIVALFCGLCLLFVFVYYKVFHPGAKAASEPLTALVVLAVLGMWVAVARRGGRG